MAQKKLSTWATTVTPLSKMTALLMLIIFPILGFYYGMYYQQQIDIQKGQEKRVPTTQSSQLPAQPPNGTISCTTNMDCPTDDICVQAGPIMNDQKQHRTCWKKGSPMPL
ncbi:MAG TPA: hypothetical protein VNW29_00030 [Candidatus Sulfotelmatobacter sp.]|jgi:hypothetical protein|nr:hypothetical protein [Candidatus Sulfotelmatobacter sp.]